jgi:hypothetical protein
MAVRQRKNPSSGWRYFVHPAPHFVETNPIEVKISAPANKMRAIDEWLERYGPLTLDRRASGISSAKTKKRERK